MEKVTCLQRTNQQHQLVECSQRVEARIETFPANYK